MKTFLEYVAADLLAKYGTDLSRIAVVFPNKRASLFLNEHLAWMAGQPLWSPAYITISDLFRSHSTLKVADPIKLVCDLHKCFTQCTGIDETLDHFYGWGQLLLSDFDDLDKNMAVADRVFANLRDIHEYDDISYLTEEQREMIRRFFSNFSEDHNTELKQRFLRLWSHIGDIYHTYNRHLADQQLAYEGALYRQVATDDTLQFEYDTYIFIGFNLLQQVEQTLFRRLRKEGKACFYWDFDDYYIGKNEAGHYIAQYLADFPNELDTHDKEIYQNFARPKQLTYISAPTENIQARYISQWLTPERIAAGRRTAVVLCNEGLLQTVIHCLPDTVDKVNVTTGYPLSQASVASLVSQLFNLRTAGYAVQTDRYRLRYVNAVLRHPYAKFISPLHQELHKELNEQRVYYPSHELLARDEGLTLLFQPLPADADTPNAALLHWLLAVIRHIAVNNRETGEGGQLASESLFRTYTLLNRVADLVDSRDLVVDVITLQRLIAQLVQSTSIPFHGEPAEGIQVMGVLETRNLDFDHVLLLSCNEGNMPRGVNDTSFIPYSIRKAYGLTTIDHKVAIYAYYFHRLLQRATDVTLVYNNSTNDGQTGEMSRFMLQMMVESGQRIDFQTLKAGQYPTTRAPQTIGKTEGVMEALRNRFGKLLSPTAIATYLRCPLRFFYRYVSGLTELDDVEEDTIDNRVFGNIFHLAAQMVYERLMQVSPTITADAISELLKTEVDIERAVDAALTQELFKPKDAKRTPQQRKEANHKLPPLDGLQLINREVIIKYVRLLLEIDRRLAPFTIIGLEEPVAQEFTIPAVGGDISINLGGYIDRLDRITDPETGEERIRVIDYKTGSHRLKALPDVDAIFDPKNIKEHSDYYLQTFLYSHIVRHTKEQPVSPALLFIQHAGADDYDPTLCLGKEPVRDIARESPRFMELLNDKIAEIFNPELPFTPTDDRTRCRSCPYAAVCGG